MPRLFTTESLLEKRQRQKIIYQETYDDCSFAFEFVSMNASKKFNEQAIMEAYEEADGFLPVDALGYLDISYSKIEKFNRLFYFTSDDADPSVSAPSLESISYGILGTHGVNPFSDANDQIFPFSNSTIKAGYANSAPVYADNTHLRHDYIRYTAKTITGGYALSDIFSNEQQLIDAVGTLDVPFNKEFSSKINDLSGCIYSESSEGWKTCKSLVTGLLDFSNETDTTTNRFKRGTKFLQDLAEQSINTFESEKNISKGEFWVKFHPGDAIAVRLTYNPENGNNQPARNSLGFLGQNLIHDRSYKIYLRFNKATLSEATLDILSEFLNIQKYERDADTAIGQKTTHMPELLTESLNALNLAKDAMTKSSDKINDLVNQVLPEKVVKTETTYSTQENLARRSDNQIRFASGALVNVKSHLENVRDNVTLVTTQMKTVSVFNKENTYPNAYAKVDALKTIMPNVANSILNIEDIVSEKLSLTNISKAIPKTYDVVDRCQKFSELNVSRDVKPVLDSFVSNMRTMIRKLNETSQQTFNTTSSNMNTNLYSVTREKRNVYRDFMFTSVAQDATACRNKERDVNEHATVIEKINDLMLQDYDTVLTERNNVFNMGKTLDDLRDKLTLLQDDVNRDNRLYSELTNPPKEMIKNVNEQADSIRTGLIVRDDLEEYAKTALARKLDSKLSNLQSFYHREKSKKIADMWVINEEVARSEALKVAAATAAKNAVVTDALAMLNTATTTRIVAKEFLVHSITIFSNAFTSFENARTYADLANVSYQNASTVYENSNVSFLIAGASLETATSVLEVANASLATATHALEVANASRDSAEKEYNAKNSDAKVLRLVASNLLAAADTVQKRETADNSALVATEAEEVAESRYQSFIERVSEATSCNTIVNGTGLGSITYANIANTNFDIAKTIYDSKNVEKTQNNDALEKAFLALQEAQRMKQKAKLDAFDSEIEAWIAEIELFMKTQLEHDRKVYWQESVDNSDVSDEMDEANANIHALVEASKDALVVGVPDATIAGFAEKCSIETSINQDNNFDIKCDLDLYFYTTTKGAYSTGYYVVRDLSDNVNLINKEQNGVNGPSFSPNYKQDVLTEGRTLHFNNRMTNSEGAKMLQVIFVYKDSNNMDKFIMGKAFSLLVTKQQYAASILDDLDYNVDTISYDSLKLELDLTCVLKPKFIEDTITADSDGYFYLRNMTTGKNLPDTSVLTKEKFQNDNDPYKKITDQDQQLNAEAQNIYVNEIVDNTLNFNNRSYTQGDKLQVRFFNTESETIFSGRTFVPKVNAPLILLYSPTIYTTMVSPGNTIPGISLLPNSPGVYNVATIQQSGDKVRFTYKKQSDIATINRLIGSSQLNINSGSFSQQTAGITLNYTKISDGVYDISGIYNTKQQNVVKTTFNAGLLTDWEYLLREKNLI